MSSQSKIYAEIPKFKDKVMYITSGESATRIETSYSVSSSYQGIVRLSPNNQSIHDENPNYQLSKQDEKNQGLFHSDAILFDDAAINAIKSNCDISRRMIIASQSTGYLVNFRISDVDVEFDNLGVIGILKSSHLVLYTTDKSQKSKPFIMNGQRMPFLPNNDTSSSSLPDITTGNYDQRKINIVGTGDKSNILYTISNADNQREYRYKATKLFLRDAIMQALLDLETIPTGSIHFVPVSIADYKALCLNSGKRQLPNQSFIGNQQDLGTCNPIIRDFLLCDGRKYKTTDFPELAKVLWKENIKHWKPIQGTESTTFLQPYKNGQDPNCNDYASQDGVKTFRVPDLRHMFISAVSAKGQNSFYDIKVDNHVNYMVGRIQTGYYFPDNMPVYSQRYKIDNHKHFIAQGTYDLTCFSSNKSFHTEEVHDYIRPRFGWEGVSANNDYRLTLEGKINQGDDKITKGYGTMYLTNHPFFMGKYYHNGFGGRNYKTNRSGNSYHAGCESVNAHYWAAIPMQLSGQAKSAQQGGYSTNSSNMTGASSINIPSVGKKYYDPSGIGLYGHENSPKFFAMLPLIKI